MIGFFVCFYCNIYLMKPDIFELLRTFSRNKFRDIKKKIRNFQKQIQVIFRDICILA